jgi:hypothetical protein
MNRAGFAALLSVLLVIGVAGTAWGSQGEPLIAGKTNTEHRPTIITNTVNDGQGLIINSHDTALAVSSTNGGGDWAMRVSSSGSSGIGLFADASGDAIVAETYGSGSSAIFANTSASGSYAIHAQAADLGSQALATFGAVSLRGGPVSFGSTSGEATVPAGAAKVTVSVDARGMTASTTGIATLQQHVHGVFVEALVPNPPASTITIYLSSKVHASTQVAWFLFN